MQNQCSKIAPRFVKAGAHKGRSGKTSGSTDEALTLTPYFCCKTMAGAYKRPAILFFKTRQGAALCHIPHCSMSL